MAFPDPQSHRILLSDLAEEKIRERLRLVWTDPLALDPTLRSEKVTRDIAERLGRLAKLLEADGHSAATVATFLMRALFTMFAEDVELLPRESFLELLKSRRGVWTPSCPRSRNSGAGWVLDCFGLTEHELQRQFPSVFHASV